MTKTIIPTVQTHDELLNLKMRDMILLNQWEAITNAFTKLWGESEKDQVVGAEQDGVAVLLEENFTKNIKHVIGVEHQFFGKLLYLWMSGGYDKAKISMQQFIECLLVFYKEDKNLHTRACFGIYDIDKDGILNILNLLHVYGNLNPYTQKEMLKSPEMR